MRHLLKKNRFFEVFDAISTFFQYKYKIKRDPSTTRPLRVLVIQNAKMGDMVCSTPVFQAVKKFSPEVILAVGGNMINKELLEHGSLIDTYIIFNNLDPEGTLSKIKEFKADFACVLTPDYFGLKLLMKAKIPLISVPKIENGLSPHETKLFKFLRTAIASKPHMMGHYVPREYLRLLEPIGIYESNTKKVLGYSIEAKNKVRETFEKHFGELNIGISPSAGNKIKQWPAERFAEIADYCMKTLNAKVFVINGMGNIKESKEMIKNLSQRDSIVDLTGQLSLDELKAFISTLDLFIAVDTGPIYIAEAFDVATIDIVGPVDENEQPPKGEFNIVVVPERNKPAIHLMNTKQFDQVEAKRQIESITSQQVIEAINLMNKRLLLRKKQKKS